MAFKAVPDTTYLDGLEEIEAAEKEVAQFFDDLSYTYGISLGARKELEKMVQLTYSAGIARGRY